MIRFITGLMIVLTVQVSGFSQENFKERTSSADVIVEGKVISKQSFWDNNRRSIYTENKIQVFKIFKGLREQTHLTVITKGGVVGNDFQLIPHSHQLGESTEGVFFLERLDDEMYKMAYTNTPLLHYEVDGNCFKAVDGQRVYTNPKDLYVQLELATGKSYAAISLNTIESSIKAWLDETLSIVSQTDILIEFTFENIELLPSGQVEFDIMAKSSQDGIRFAASDVYITYNTDAFGINIVENDKIEASKETVIENEVYTLELTDETASVVKFLVDAEIVPNELYYLSQVAEKFLHVEIDIDNIIELATISFDVFSMSNQSFFYDEVSGEFVGFDKVAVDDPFSAFLIPQIGGISPNPVPAGTRLDEHILVITKTEEPGNGFGNHNNPDGTFNQNCTECRVRFVDSDNPFGHVYARGADIISWTDEEIRLNVPSATAIDGFYQHSAASGEMRVESPTGNSDEVDINIPYSVLNFQPNPTILNPARRFASALQTENGIVFNYHEDVVGGKKVETDRAFSKWCETTDIGWVISDLVLDDSDISGLLDGMDNRNVISIQPDGEFSSANARAFVKITGHFAFCPPSSVAYIRDVDVVLRDDPFQSDEADRWYNFVLHELGHAHLLYHSINPDEGTLEEYIMHYDLSDINNLGDSQMGILHRHPIQANDEEGAETIFSSSTNLLSTCSPSVAPIDNIGCTGANNTANIPEYISDVIVYPNPLTGGNLYLSLSLDARTDFVIDILAITGQEITSKQYVSGQVGQNLIELHNLEIIPRGSYLVRVSSESNSFLVKFVQL